MSKITFRADDELIEQLEEFDASKSEVMREALRTYLDGEASGASQNGASATGATPTEDSLDDLVAERKHRSRRRFRRVRRRERRPT